ncbi:hypothetical protein RB195_001218 [Necator americanus]|uniref:Uncharacterized protein n=1 Tax=Necator americanus TaxID=51031 RepID=A0ABR1DEH8_NECAM
MTFHSLTSALLSTTRPELRQIHEFANYLGSIRCTGTIFKVIFFRYPQKKGSSWWRNLVMDDDKTRAPKAPPTAPEIIIGDNQALNGSLEERHRNISTISMGDKNEPDNEFFENFTVKGETVGRT